MYIILMITAWFPVYFIKNYVKRLLTKSIDTIGRGSEMLVTGVITPGPAIFWVPEFFHEQQFRQ